MEISFDIFLFFWIEKKLVLLSHVCSILYKGLVLWLWSLELNDNAYSIKKLPFWSSSYLATLITFFASVDFFIFFVVYIITRCKMT